MISKYSHFIQGDRVIWFAVVMLSIFGMLAVYSSTGTLAYKLQDGNTEYFLVKQLGMAAIGLVLMWFFHFLPYRLFAQNIFFPFFGLSIFLLILVLFGVMISTTHAGG